VINILCCVADPVGLSPVMTLLDPQMDTSIPALFAIYSVQFCPYHPHLVLCVALDGIMVRTVVLMFERISSSMA